MALVDRIADLPGIEAIDRDDRCIPSRVDVCVQRPGADRARREGSLLQLCSLSGDGIAVYGLDRWGRYQALARGWGVLVGDHVLVCLPRDRNELEVVWSIVKRAYDNQYVAPGHDTGARVISTWDWPKFSRTTLQ